MKIAAVGALGFRDRSPRKLPGEMHVQKISPRFRISAALLATLVSLAAQAQMKVGVIASSTGPTAVVGIPQKNTAALLPRKIGGVDVE